MKKNYAISVFALIGMMLFSAFPIGVAAEELPDWLPTQKDIKDYSLLWNGSEVIDNFICADKTNISIYNQVWYKNDTDGKTKAMIGQCYADLTSKVFDEELKFDSQIAETIFRGIFPDFKGTTRWDFFVYIMNITAATTDVSKELGWDHAIEFNYTGFLEYVICGTIDTRFVISIAFDIDTDWFMWGDALLSSTIGTVVTSFLLMMAAFTTIGAECPEASTISADVVPTATSESTSREDMVAFNKKVAKVMSGSIDGFPLGFLALFAIVPIVRLMKKRK